MKVRLIVLMEALVHQRKTLVLILVKEAQNFVSVCIIMVIIVICLLMEKRSSRLKPIMEMSTFQLNFVWEAYLIDLVLLSLEKYL